MIFRKNVKLRMTTYKFVLQKEELMATNDVVFETIHELISEDESVVAGTLRAIANKLDPSRPTRNHNYSNE